MNGTRASIFAAVVACDSEAGVLGYVCTGRFRNKLAYDTTVESSVACRPEAARSLPWTGEATRGFAVPID
jgi:L-amino acid N-acyltransferase YncA